MKKLFSALLSVTFFSAFLSCTGRSVSADYIPEGTSFYESEENSENGLGWLYFDDSAEVLSSYQSENSYSFGAYLDKNNTDVYNAFIKLAEPSVEQLTVKLSEPVSIELSTNIPSKMTDEDNQIYSSALFASCRPGIDSALFDVPELFWLDITRMGVTVKNYSSSYNIRTKKYTIVMEAITFSPDFFEAYGSMESVLEYKQRLSEAAANAPIEGETRYEKLKSIHDHICNFTYYDLEAPFRTSAVGAIVEPGAVCEGYAEGFKIICDSIGIPCILVVGNFSSTDDEGHMWNYVQMEDGKWYAIDVTWDDLNGKNGEELQHKYFLKGSDSFSKNHTPVSEFGITMLNYPELSESDYVQPSTETDPEYETGDVNHDGKVNVADIVYCSGAVLKTHTPEFSCDVNNDGMVDAFDIVLIRKLVIEKSSD